MRIRRQEGYLLQKIGNTHYLLPYGQKIADQQRGMELNETARILWEALETPKTMEELQQKMIRCYEVPEEEQEELKKDIQAFVQELLAFGAVRRELGSPDLLPSEGCCRTLTGLSVLQRDLRTDLLTDRLSTEIRRN